MSDNTVTQIAEAPFSANFKLFDPEGVQVQFTVRAVSADEHLSNLTTYRSALAAQGFAPSEPTAPEGKVEEIGAYVRGFTKAGQPLAWLYSAKEVFKYRVTTVYEEDLPALPFQVEGPTSYPTGVAAPERQTAEANKALVKVSPFKVVLIENGQDEKGRTKYKFSHVAGQAPKNGNGNNGNGNGSTVPAAPAAAANSGPAAVEITFGKYKGLTCGQVVAQDPNYARWLSENAQRADVKDAITTLLGKPAPAAAAPAGNGSNVPF